MTCWRRSLHAPSLKISLTSTMFTKHSKLVLQKKFTALSIVLLNLKRQRKTSSTHSMLKISSKWALNTLDMSHSFTSWRDLTKVTSNATTSRSILQTCVFSMVFGTSIKTWRHAMRPATSTAESITLTLSWMQWSKWTERSDHKLCLSLSHSISQTTSSAQPSATHTVTFMRHISNGQKRAD